MKIIALFVTMMHGPTLMNISLYLIPVCIPYV
uniref:Uncharacterized protein n=1 Tax=Rhizophora mucronata TaxID=61149 RepID=A0A2P2QS02_RHIMU